MATQTSNNYVKISFNHGSTLCSPVFSTHSKLQWKMEYLSCVAGNSPAQLKKTLYLLLVSGASSAEVFYSVKVRNYNIEHPEHYLGKTIVTSAKCASLKVSYSIHYNPMEADTTLELYVLGVTPVVEVPTESSLSSALSSVLHSEEGHDLTLYFGQENTPLKASKFMLKVRSPVFKAMFQSGLKEAKDSTVPIPDISPEVGEEMITYMYTDKTPNISTMPEELWLAAEKYQLPGLKALCENELDRQLNKDTAARILLFTGRYYGDGALRDRAVNLITQNKETYTHVKKSKDWEEVVKDNELLLAINDKVFAEPPEKRARLS